MYTEASAYCSDSHESAVAENHHETNVMQYCTSMTPISLAPHIPTLVSKGKLLATAVASRGSTVAWSGSCHRIYMTLSEVLLFG